MKKFIRELKSAWLYLKYSYKRMGLWTFVSSIIVAFGVPEVYFIVQGKDWYYHASMIVGAFALGWIKREIKDDNNNGIVDRWE